MEVVAPLRNRGNQPSQERDENDETSTIQPAVSRRARQTVHWPFQSVATVDTFDTLSTLDTNASSFAYFPLRIPAPSAAHQVARRATWQPQRHRSSSGICGDEDEESLDPTLIPDYVVNYLRGETPESVARRKAVRTDEQSRASLDDDRPGNDSDIRIHRQRDCESFSTAPPSSDDSDNGILNTGTVNEKRLNGGWINSRRLPFRQTWAMALFHAQGSRGGLVLSLAFSLLLLIAALICLVLATLLGRENTSPSSPYLPSGFAQVYSDGSCAVADRTVWLLRALLAVLTATVLAVAAYAFQILSSPTRAELDAAHARRRWLDIGVPSLRNIFFLLTASEGGGYGRSRAALALLLIISALLSAILYGSGLVQVTTAVPLAPAPDYAILLVTPAFISGGSFRMDTSNNAALLGQSTVAALQQAVMIADRRSRDPGQSQARSQRLQFLNLSTAECVQTKPASRLQMELQQFRLDTTGRPRLATDPSHFSAVLLILDSTTGQSDRNNSVVQTAPAGSALLAANTVFPSTRSMLTFTVDTSSVAYCLAQTVTTTTWQEEATACDVSLCLPLLGGIVALNMVTVVCLGLVLLLQQRQRHRGVRQTPLVTLGDAVASLLQDPDPTTGGACLLSKRDVLQGRWTAMAAAAATAGTGGPQQPENILQPIFWAPRDYRWFRSPSWASWLAVSLAWLTMAGLAAAGLAFVVTSSAGLGTFGRIDAATAVFGQPASTATAVATLAGLPQLGPAVLCLLINGLLSEYFLSHESSLYGVGERHPLRVSQRPQGHQTTSMYLTLPPSWSWALLGLLAGLSFVLGQSVVATGLRAPTSLGALTASAASAAPQLFLLGFSGAMMLLLWPLLALLAALVLGLGARLAPSSVQAATASVLYGRQSPLRLALSPPQKHSTVQHNGNPLTLPGGSCSAVISARCHPTPEETTAEAAAAAGGLPLWMRPLAWGVVPVYHHANGGYNRPRGGESGDDEDEDDTEATSIDAVVHHGAYSSHPVTPLEPSQSYA